MAKNDPDRPITFNAAAKFLPEDYRPSNATWWRWWKKGVKGIRLQTLVIGGRRYTTATFVAEWISRVTATANNESPPVRTPARRERDICRAEREMAAEQATMSTDRNARHMNRRPKALGAYNDDGDTTDDAQSYLHKPTRNEREERKNE